MMLEQRIVTRASIICEDRVREDMGDIEGLANSFKQYGLMQPLVVMQLPDEKYKLLAGGRRFAAITLAELDPVPVNVYDREPTLIEMKEIELEENLQRKNLSWSEQVKLTEEIHNLRVQQHGRSSATGWKQSDTAKLRGVSEFTVSNDLTLAAAIHQNPELAKVKSKAEAIAQITKKAETALKQELARRASENKTLQCVDNYILGDFFEKSATIPDHTIDFVELDPPWGVSYDQIEQRDGGQSSAFTDITKEQYPEYLDNILTICERIMKPTSWLVCWYSLRYHHQTTIDLLTKHGFKVASLPAIWCKPGTTPSRPIHGDNELVSGYETFLYAGRGDARTVNIRSNSFMFMPPLPSERSHPTEKPVELMLDILQTFCFPGARVVVPFAGSGNTLIAAQRADYQAFGYDIVEEFRSSYILKIQAEQEKKS